MIIDSVFVLAATAFFKERLGLQGWGAIGAAFLLSLFVYFQPELLALVPSAAPAIEKVIELVKLFLTAPGLFDLVVNVGAKINKL